MPTEQFHSHMLGDMLNCEKFHADGKQTLRIFHDRAAFRLRQIFESEPHRIAFMKNLRGDIEEPIPHLGDDGISSLQSIFQDVLDDIHVNKKSLKKGEDALINALYVCILDILRPMLSANDFKYRTREEFLVAYGDRFANETDREKTLLWQTANWMSILFKMITAKKNTGLTIEVIPKIVEGWHAKYITGGGMKPATVNRVHLLHTEGQIPFKHRGNKRSSNKGMGLDSDDEHHKARSRGRPSAQNNRKRKQRSSSPSSPPSSPYHSATPSPPYHGNRRGGKKRQNSIGDDSSAGWSHDSFDRKHTPPTVTYRLRSDRTDEENDEEYYNPDPHPAKRQQLQPFQSQPQLQSSSSSSGGAGAGAEAAAGAGRGMQVDAESGGGKWEPNSEDYYPTWSDEDDIYLEDVLFPTQPAPAEGSTSLPSQPPSSSSSSSSSLGGSLKMPLPVPVGRQVSLGLGFNFSRVELGRECSWTLYEPKQDEGKEQDGKDPKQEAKEELGHDNPDGEQQREQGSEEEEMGFPDFSKSDSVP